MELGWNEIMIPINYGLVHRGEALLLAKCINSLGKQDIVNRYPTQIVWTGGLISIDKDD